MQWLVAGFAILVASSPSVAIPLHLHVDGVVRLYPDEPAGALLGIEDGDPMSIDLFYDPAAADLFLTGGPKPDELAFFTHPNPNFFVTATLGPVTFSSEWAEPGSEGAVSSYHTSDFQDLQISSRVGTGPDCEVYPNSPTALCAELFVLFRDELSPFGILPGGAIDQLPDLTAGTYVLGSIEGYLGGGFYFHLDPQSYSIEVVPEPGTGVLLATGLLLLGRWRSPSRGPGRYRSRSASTRALFSASHFS